MDGARVGTATESWAPDVLLRVEPGSRPPYGVRKRRVSRIGHRDLGLGTWVSGLGHRDSALGSASPSAEPRWPSPETQVPRIYRPFTSRTLPFTVLNSICRPPWPIRAR